MALCKGVKAQLVEVWWLTLGDVDLSEAKLSGGDYGSLVEVLGFLAEVWRLIGISAGFI